MGKVCNFYPRPPRGGRLRNGVVETLTFKFLSTPSARRATAKARAAALHPSISIHALREEGDKSNSNDNSSRG